MHCNFICGLLDVIIKTFNQSVSQSVTNGQTELPQQITRLNGVATYKQRCKTFTAEPDITVCCSLILLKRGSITYYVFSISKMN